MVMSSVKAETPERGELKVSHIARVEGQGIQGHPAPVRTSKLGEQKFTPEDV